MKKICLLSGYDKTKYLNELISKELKQLITKPKLLVAISTSPDNYAKNDIYFKGNDEVVGIIKIINKIFPELEEKVLLDRRISKDKGIEYLNNADIIFLLGGNPFTGLKYIKENGFDNIIKKSDALIIGVSAGSMNLAVNSYYSKDENYQRSIFYKGIGLIDITIDPHFDINNKEQVDEAIINSKKHKIIGLPNESAIIINDNDIIIVGEKYVFEKGVLIK